MRILDGKMETLSASIKVLDTVFMYPIPAIVLRDGASLKNVL